MGCTGGVPAAEKIETFYEDYHRSLAEQGIDGVKVDVQAMLEGVSAGQGVMLVRAYRQSLENSLAHYFHGRPNSGRKTATLEVLACIAFKQPISEAEIVHFRIG